MKLGFIVTIPKTNQQFQVFESEDRNEIKTSEKCRQENYCLFFSPYGHRSKVPLEEQHTVNAEWYTILCLSHALETF